MKNFQIKTMWHDKNKKKLTTRLISSELPSLKQDEILVEMLYVPILGSFWLATHPEALHPRIDELMETDGFVFGNGGVGKVIESNVSDTEVGVGDYVCIYGHYPCNNYDCYACNVLNRYVECDYNQGKIVGHGKNSYEGTYARYVILPKQAYEVCYKAHENPTAKQLTPFMYGFLLADVRNALTRHTDTLRMRRMLLFGAGCSGLTAAYIHNRTCPESKIFVIDSSEQRLEKVRDLDPDAIKTFKMPTDIVEQLNSYQKRIGFRHEQKKVVENIRTEMKKHFGGRGCNILFDASSGNTAPLWDNKRILSPTAHCIIFGFGSEYILLNRELIQLSGLTIMMSRGVGNIRNRKEVIELIKAGANKFINRSLLSGIKEIDGLDNAIKFIETIQYQSRFLHNIEPSYIKFSRNI
jgi:threonine dehydrogenase-like Zn-dependent dehydrogenase